MTDIESEKHNLRMKKISLAFAFMAYSAFSFGANPILEDEITDNNRYNPRKSHFFIGANFEGMKMPTPFDFQGAKKDLKPRDQDLWGARLTFGGELYLGAGFMTTTRLEGYYMGTLFSETLNGGSQDADVKFAYTKKHSQVFGGEASQSLGYVFNMKTKNPIMEEWSYLTVEPFIEAGFGVGRAYNNVNYKYELAGTDELYKLKVNDDLTNAKLAIGINFTSSHGFYFFLKATQNRFDITNKKSRQVTRINGSGTDVVTNPKFDDKIHNNTTYAIGGGYKF